jgi:trehalose 6-phosphate phosphatase
MQHLFDEPGLAALAALMRRDSGAARPLLAFDFDGTLAPIVARPDDARLPEPIAQRLARLARRHPVAIVTGRAVADVRGRLGAFVPTYVVGNHGAEDETGDASAARRLAQALDPLRAVLARERPALAAAGVVAEDKGLSLALHYRQARDPDAARALIGVVLGEASRGLEVSDGKFVVNAVAHGAPDKAHAVHRLVARSGADGALFAGDDLNDEPVFAAAAPGWVTVRIGHGPPRSIARWYIDGTAQMGELLDRLLAPA